MVIFFAILWFIELKSKIELSKKEVSQLFIAIAIILILIGLSLYSYTFYDRIGRIIAIIPIIIGLVVIFLVSISYRKK